MQLCLRLFPNFTTPPFGASPCPLFFFPTSFLPLHQLDISKEKIMLHLQFYQNHSRAGNANWDWIRSIGRYVQKQEHAEPTFVVNAASQIRDGIQYSSTLLLPGKVYITNSFGDRSLPTHVLTSTGTIWRENCALVLLPVLKYILPAFWCPLCNCTTPSSVPIYHQP